jgi:hypothetical protein
MKKLKSLFLMLASLASTGIMAQTTLPAKKFVLDVNVHTSSSSRFLALGGWGDPTSFNATLQIVEGVDSLSCYDETNFPPEVIIDCAYIPPKADFYFGVIAPDGNVYSLTPGTNTNPLKGLVPIATNVDLSKARTLDLSESVGSISYSFGYDDATKMYTVFALLVIAGANPADAPTWLEAEMKPLIVQPTLLLFIDDTLDPNGPFEAP